MISARVSLDQRIQVNPPYDPNFVAPGCEAPGLALCPSEFETIPTRRYSLVQMHRQSTSQMCPRLSVPRRLDRSVDHATFLCQRNALQYAQILHNPRL